MPDPYREPIEEKSGTARELEQMPAKPEVKEQPVAPEKSPVMPWQEKTSPSQAPVSAAPPAAVSPAQTSLPTDLENDRRLKILIDLAFSQGIDKAVEAARASENPYLIDKFHDTLVDELRQKLIDTGKLKET